MSLEDEVRAELKVMNGDKAKLLQKLSEQAKNIIDSYGGNLSDVPVDSENPYYQIQAKLQLLNRM